MRTFELNPLTRSFPGSSFRALMPGAAMPPAVLPTAMPTALVSGAVVSGAALPGEALTRRERVVLSNLAEDVTLEQIARTLFVTRNTVKSQVRSVYRKLGVSNRAEAVAWARRLGLTTAMR